MQVEYLWAPCSFLEPSGTDVIEAVDGEGGGGVVTLVPVREFGDSPDLVMHNILICENSCFHHFMHIISFNKLFCC